MQGIISFDILIWHNLKIFIIVNLQESSHSVSDFENCCMQIWPYTVYVYKHVLKRLFVICTNQKV